jgi:predicted secreted protein
MLRSFRSLRSCSLALSPLAILACSACHDGGAPPANTPDTSVATTTAALPSAPSASGTVSTSADTAVHVEDDGKSVDVMKGSTVTVSLASNAGTGYRWVPTKVDPNILAQQGDRTVESASPSAAAVPGGPTNEVYHFTAAGPGTTALEMSLKRPFGSGDPARTIHVTINVH